jgi:hypothetical protein
MSCSMVALLAVLRSAVVRVLDSCVGCPGSSTHLCFFFLLKHVYNGYGDYNISLLSSFCIFFLSSFAHIPEREDRTGFLNVLWRKLFIIT